MLERIVRAAVRAARGPWSAAVGAAGALGGGLLALGLAPERGAPTRWSAAADRRTGRPSATTSASATTPSIVLVRGDAAEARADPRPRARCSGWRAASSGNMPAGQQPPGGANGPVRARWPGRSRCKVVYGPGTFINESVRQIEDSSPASSRPRPAQARRPTAARKLAARAGCGGRARTLASQARQLVRAEFLARPLRLALQYGLTRAAADQRPELRLPARVRPGARGEHAEGALRLPVPEPHSALVQVRLRPGLTDAERDAAIALIRDGDARCRELAAAQRRPATWSPARRSCCLDLTDAHQRARSSCCSSRRCS